MATDFHPAVSCRDLTKTYNAEVLGIEDLSFDIPYGKVTGLLGPNGAGKSTTVNVLTTAIRPTSGEFWIAGLHGKRDRLKIRNVLGIVSQDFAVDWALTVRQHLNVFASLYGKSADQANSEIDMWLNAFDLSGKADTKILQLSGGQGRRVQLIRCLLADPPIVFVDEPTLGLDPKGVQVVLNSLRQMASRGKCVVMASNAVEEVEASCDDVIFLRRGRLLDYDSVQHFLDRYGGLEVVTLTVVSDTAPDAMWWGTYLDPEIEEIGPRMWQISFSVDDARGAVPSLVDLAFRSGLTISDVSVKSKTLKNIYLNLSSIERSENGE